MKFKNLFKNYNFWISFIAFLILLAQIICKSFGVHIHIPAVSEILTSVCALFIFWGVLTIPDSSDKNSINEIKNKVEQDVKEKINSFSEKLESKQDEKKEKEDNLKK